MEAQLKPLLGNDNDDDDEEDSNLTSFFALKKSHFPVVCTYDEFLNILESTIRFEHSDFPTSA
jgi:hypothetical protein